MKKGLLILSIAAMLVLATATIASAAPSTNTNGYGPLEYNIISGGTNLDAGWPSTGMVNPEPATKMGTVNHSGANQWQYFAEGEDKGYAFTGYTTSTHPQGTWNSPYTTGVDGYNYNDPQDYVDNTGGFIGMPMGYGFDPFTGLPAPIPDTVTYPPYTFYYGFMWNGAPMNMWFPAYVSNWGAGTMGVPDGDEIYGGTTPGAKGPHGDYLTSTHKCRECHAVHRAAGKFKLTRSDTRMGACDWCHGTGAGSGFNIQMDNDDNMSREYDVGHSLGFGLSSGKWKAPDDTDPAYTPKFYMGGFSCFDCHSPHANKSRILGYVNNQRFDFFGTMSPSVYNVQVPGFILNSGATEESVTKVPWPLTNPTAYTSPKYKPIYPAGKWLLLENPDANEGVDDSVAGTSGSGGPINKMVTNWNMPYGTSDVTETNGGLEYFNMGTCMSSTVSEFCTDCHDGNAGLHTQQASMFSEDRALRNQVSAYDIGYSHDTNSRHCGRQMKFNPEDADLTTVPTPTPWGVYTGPGAGDFGPHCRNCHRGSSDCGVCHENRLETHALAGSDAQAAANSTPPMGGTSTFDALNTDLGATKSSTMIEGQLLDSGYWKHERTVEWASDWRTNPGILDSTCSNDGFSWPHRTMGFKLLKDEMWGLDFDGTFVSVGQTRNGIPDYISSDGNAYPMTASNLPSKLYNKKAEDLDSACLDCHNPNVWNVFDRGDSADPNNRLDTTGTAADDYNDELILRGLP